MKTHLAAKFWFMLISVTEVFLAEPLWSSFWRSLLSLSDMFSAS
jgi:hypothetical protein